MNPPTRGQRRERREMGNTLFLRCFCSQHNGKWLPADRFGVKRISPDTRHPIYHSRCAESRRNVNQVETTQMRPFLRQIVVACGSYNAAARTLGTSTPALLRWMGRYRGQEGVRRMHRTTANRVVRVAIGLRVGTITPDTRQHTGGKTYHHGCSQCGYPLEEETAGCRTCWERHSKRRRRAA